MKKLIILAAVLIFAVSSLFSGMRAIDLQEEICNQFLEINSQNSNIDNVYELTTERETLANIYTLSDQGFVVVTADENLFPVIAYSRQGSYDPIQNKDDLQFRFLKEEIKLRKDYYRDNPEAVNDNLQKWHQMISTSGRPGRPFQQWPMDGTTNTDGWCKTQWDQSGVYNDMCPLDNSGNRSVVGCVATAMAQIMYFHEYAGNPVFNSGDNYYSGWWDPIHIDSDHEELDFPAWAELNDYMEDVTAHFASGETLSGTDLAALNYACGVSVEMSYSSEGSGAMTGDVAAALRNKFDYDTATWSENYGGSFYNTISNDMKHMRPCEFSIYTPGWNDGHAIVCDGYNTNDYFHLNYGWGTSNIGWYYLPEGMPSNYSIIGGAVNNIEGGEVPLEVTGDINGPSNLENCHVVLEGEDYSFEAYADGDGEFLIDAVLPGWYTVSAVLERTWYFQEEMYIDEGSNSFTIDLFNFEALTGNIEAPVSPEGALVAIYENGVLLETSSADLNGNFSIDDILPGTYYVTATLHPNYFGVSEVTVTPENQYALIEMENYDENYIINWAGEASELHHIVPLQISCAIKLSYEDLENTDNNLLAGVSFISPINSDEGSLSTQLWRGEQLIVEEDIHEFTSGEEVNCLFPYFELIEPDQDYFVGYGVYSETGDIAWHDAGPRVEDKGAWFRINGWVELTDIYDYNFCISAEILTGVENNAINDSGIIKVNRFESCYPNPFIAGNSRGIANLSYYLDKDSHVKIDCYNLKGQNIAEVFNGYSASGKTSLNWTPENVGSGLYFYKLQVDGIDQDTRKFIIIK